MKTFRFTMIAAAALFASSAFSQAADADNVIKISTGGSKGTYTAFFKSIQARCGDKLQLIEVPSGGSDDNIDNLISKKADAAFVQTDTLQFTALNDPRAGDNNIRVLLPMYPEEVHVVALKSLAKVTGGFSAFGRNIGGTAVSLNSLADLHGMKVGAWGGSYTTARAIQVLGNAGYEPAQYKDAAAAFAALKAGEIAAVVAVGGQPMQSISELGPDFKLLTIDRALADKVRAYVPATVSYKNLGAAGVTTVAARSVLAVKNYTTPDRRAKLAALKQCIVKNEGEFKEGTGHHAKWSDVDFSQPVAWASYDVGSAAPAPAGKKK